MSKEDKQFTYKVTLRRVSANIVAVEKQRVLHKLCVFIALGIQHAMCMCHSVICDLHRSTLFSHVIS